MSKKISDLDFSCKCGCGLDNVSHELLENFESFINLFGFKIENVNIHSACRCVEHNASVGGVFNSQHVKGLAIDFSIDDVDIQELYEKVLDSELFDGVGYYEKLGFIHVDLRDYGHSINGYLW